MRESLLSLVIIGLAGFAAIAPASAQDQTQRARIGTMELKELVQFVGAITNSVGQDTLKLQPAAQRNDCLELTRAANSFALGYAMLGEADRALVGKPAKEALAVKAHIVQSRVITFAARVRAEEWLGGRCASFVAPADRASDPRYSKPAKLQTAEYTQAVIDAREAAEANLAAAVSAGLSKKCPQVLGAMQSIQLFVPYIEKLVKDVARRPEALGPRASRRGLEVSRLQLINAGNKLYREIGIGCAGAPPPQEGEEGKPAAPAAPSQEPTPEGPSPTTP